MTDIRDTYDGTVKVRGPVTEVIDNIRQGMPDMNVQLFSMLVPDFPDDFIKQQSGDVEGLKKDFGTFNTQWDTEGVRGASDAEKAKMTELRAAESEWLKALRRIQEPQERGWQPFVEGAPARS